MSVEEESVYFLVFTVARVAGPKTGGGEGGKSDGNPHPPSLFLFESPTLSTLPRRLFVQLRPKRRTKQPLMCRSKSLAFIRPLTCVDVLVCWAKPELLFMTFKSSAESCYLPLRGWGRLWYCLLGAFLIPGSFNSRSLYKWRMTILFVNFFIYFENKFT